MTYSVSAVTAATQKIDLVTDSYSTDMSTPGLCGGLNYSITSSPVTALFPLTTSEVKISSAGVITAYTSNAATAGTHNVTVTETLTSYSSTVASVFSTFTLTITAPPK
jgi:hypothetical protein